MFNVHIGKSITVRRALGLEVPKEYWTVPKPTEIRVGNVVKWKDSDNSYVITFARGDNFTFRCLKTNKLYYEYYSPNLILDLIVDDSRQ